MKITKDRLRQLIEQEVKTLLEDEYEHGKEEREQERAGIQEGFENITAENLALAMQALKQVAINFSPALAGAIAAGAYAELKDKVSKPDAEDE